MSIRRRACMNKPELWRAVHHDKDSGERTPKPKFFNSPTPVTTATASPTTRPTQSVSTKSTPKSVSPSPLPSVSPSPYYTPISTARTNNSALRNTPRTTLQPKVQVLPQARKLFEVNNKRVDDLGALFMMAACSIKYRGVCMNNDTMNDIRRAIRRHLRLPLTDTNVTANHLFYNEARDVFGVECLITPVGNTNALKAIKLLYWVELGIAKDQDGYRTIQVYGANKFTERPPGFILIT